MEEVLAVEVKPEVEAAPKLTTKQERFVQEYLVDFNATQAAIRAGYSKNHAGQKGWELLNTPRIKVGIDLAKVEHIKKIEATQEGIVTELQAIAFAKEEKTRDRIEALKLLGRHLGMFGSDTQFNLNTGNYKIEIVEVGRPVDIQ